MGHNPVTCRVLGVAPAWRGHGHGPTWDGDLSDPGRSRPDVNSFDKYALQCYQVFGLDAWARRMASRCRLPLV